MTRLVPRGFIVDACVLIDYLNADISILSQFSKKFGPIFVTLDTLIEEVNGLDVASCARFEISVFEPNEDQLAAAGLSNGALSFFDYLLFLSARDNDWTVVSNDSALNRACRAVGINVVRGLYPLIELVNAGDMSKKEGDILVKAMIDSNRHLSKRLLREFRKKIGE